MKQVVIIGGRGNGTVILSTLEDCIDAGLEASILGFVNDSDEEMLEGYPVLGSPDPDTLARLVQSHDASFIWALTSVKLRSDSRDRFESLLISPDRLVTVVHPSAVVSRHAKIESGSVIHPLVNVGAGAVVGRNVQVFAQAMVGHDARLDDFSYVANNGSVGGRVHLEEGAYLGTAAAVRENVTLGAWSIVGMGAVVLDSVAPGTTVVGAPARPR